MITKKAFLSLRVKIIVAEFMEMNHNINDVKFCQAEKVEVEKYFFIILSCKMQDILIH